MAKNSFQSEDGATTKENLLSNGTEEVKTFEELLQIINPMGKWQIWIYFWMAFYKMWASQILLIVVFFQITPEFACDIGNSSWTFEETKKLM